MSSMDSEEEQVPSKRPHSPSAEWKSCVICSREAPNAALVSPRDLSSWDTLLEPARIRAFELILQLSSSDDTLPKISHHRECRNTFTHKKDLNCIWAACAAHDLISQEQRKSSSDPVANSSRVYENVCIFFNQKSSKYIRKSQTQEHLIQSQ